METKTINYPQCVIPREKWIKEERERLARLGMEANDEALSRMYNKYKLELTNGEGWDNA